MRKFKFDNNKYGFELMMDLYSLESIGDSHFEPNFHTIDFFEILFLESSSGTILINGHATNLLPFTIVFASPNQIKKNNIQNVKGYHLVFESEFLSTFFADKLFVHRLQFFYNSVVPQFYRMEDEEFKFIKTLLYEIRKEIITYKTDSKHIIRSLLYFVLIRLNRSYSLYHNLSAETQINNVAYRFKEAIEMKYHTFHQVKDYAELLNLERTKLNKIIKSYSGLTPKQLIHSRLIQEIKTELIYTDKTISEIAFSLGFSEPNNMARLFMSKEGISPTVFRNLSK